MIYTVKQLSDLSGVSTRTLRFYHQTGLLVPDHVGENGYRYYKEEQALMLQQILFFRELGFKLQKIQEIVSSNSFDKLTSLISHKATLTSNIERTKSLINTIDKTIEHITGKVKVSSKELYSGFDKINQAEYDKYLIKTHGEIANSFIAESKERTKGWEKDDFIRVRNLHDQLYREFVVAMNEGFESSSFEVQKLVKRHYELVKIFYTPTKKTYATLAKTYCDHSDFRSYFDSFNLELAEFLAQGIRHFAEHNFDKG